MTTTVSMNLFSPRWGHDDSYTIILEENIMNINMSARKATCTWNSDNTSTWSQHLGSNALDKILDNDSIYPPENFKELLVKVWRSWVNGELDNDSVQTELTELETWVNVITKATPKSDYWRANF